MLALPAVFLLTSCGTTRINRLLAEPLRYQNRDVNVEGTVTNSFGALVAGVYQVDDGTGKIFVISNGPVPTKGARVKVEGTLNNGVTLGGRSYGTALRSHRYKVRY
jgi:hypothetical protein